MNIPNQEALLRAYPCDVWSQAAIMSVCAEGMLAKIVPVGGSIACDSYMFERTKGGMHITENLEGRPAHIDIDVDIKDDEKEICGQVVPDKPIDPAVLAERNINLILTGEDVRDKLRKYAHALEKLTLIDAA